MNTIQPQPETLFSAAEAWEGDPLKPGTEAPTPWEIVAGLTRTEREQRVRHLIAQAHEIHQAAIDEHSGGHEVVANVLLFSGGNDSTVLGHLFKDVASHAAHANTGIGIEATRQFVRDTCASWNLPLIEKHPPVSYRELVLERGFPGPAMHFKMYQRLKERCLHMVRRDFVQNGRKQRIVYIAGRRRAESVRRTDIPLHERIDSTIWASPIAMWTKLDMATYRLMMKDVPVNIVSEHVGMSGECLCGAFAKPGELDMIRTNYPDVAEHIESLERDVLAAGNAPEKYCKWGHGLVQSGREASKPESQPGHVGLAHKTGPMCTSCNLDTDPLWELIESQAA